VCSSQKVDQKENDDGKAQNAPAQSKNGSCAWNGGGEEALALQRRGQKILNRERLGLKKIIESHPRGGKLREWKDPPCGKCSARMKERRG